MLGRSASLAQHKGSWSWGRCRLLEGEEPQLLAALSGLDGFPHLPLIQARLLAEGCSPTEGLELLDSVGLLPDCRGRGAKGRIDKEGVSLVVFYSCSVLTSLCPSCPGGGQAGLSVEVAGWSLVRRGGGGLWPGG